MCTHTSIKSQKIKPAIKMVVVFNAEALEVQINHLGVSLAPARNPVTECCLI